jgi:protein-S-isoprenylcysteine O-methyltransferase Ste14
LAAWVAGVLATQQWWLLSTVAVMFWLYWSAALFEEDKFATGSLAREYAAYTATTGRFLPRLW